MNCLQNVLSVISKVRINKSPVIPPINWEFQYEADALPNNSTPAWENYGTPTTAEINPAGFLHIVTDNLGDNAYFLTAEIDFTNEFVFETSMKVINGQAYNAGLLNSNSYFEVSEGAGTHGFSLYFFNDAVVLQGKDYVANDNDYVVHMIDTSEFHTYQVKATRNTVKLYVDTILIGEVDTINDSGNTGIYWALDEVGAANMETSWDYIYYTN